MLTRQSGIAFLLLLMQITSYCFSEEFISNNSSIQIVENNKYVQILLSSYKDTYNSCEPIILSITATNISDATVVFLMPPDFSENKFTYSIYNNTQNMKSEVTSYGNMLYQGHFPRGVSGYFLNFKPNDTYTKKFQIDRIYDMSLSGDYIISASFACFDLASKTGSYPKSNTIQIRITDENPSILDDSDIVVPSATHSGPEPKFIPQVIKVETGTIKKP